MTQLLYLYLQGSDFWVPSKKYIGDGAFPEKIVNMDLSEISQDRIDIVAATYISHPEWDIGNNQDFCFDATHSAHRAEYCRAAQTPPTIHETVNLPARQYIIALNKSQIFRQKSHY